MSTRSNIAFRLYNGTIISVYCHWDGYPTNNGDILLRSYKDEEKIVSLLRGGSFSALRPNIKKIAYYAKNNKADWEYSKPSFYATEEDWLKGDLEEWGYLFKDGSWFVVDCHCKTEDRKLVPLTKSYIEDYDKREKKEYLRYAFEKEEKKPFTYEVLRDKFGVTKKMAKALFDDGFFAKTKDGFIVI